MTDLPNKPGNSSSSSPVRESHGGNRLTIAHLLLWMTTTALFMSVTAPSLKLVQGYSDEQDASYQQQIRVLKYIIVLNSPFAGAGIAAVALAGWRFLRGGPPFPTQPGHWLLILLGTGTSVRLLFAIAERISMDYFGGVSFLIIGFGASLLLMALVLALAVRSVREPLRWRLTFQILAAYGGALFALSCCCLPEGWFLFAIFYLVGPASILATAVRDIAVRAEYDVFHWVGVIAGISVALIIFATPFVVYLTFFNP